MSGAATPPAFELGPARLRPFEPDDAAAWLAVVTDPAVAACTSWSVTAEVSALVARILRGYADGSSRTPAPRRGSLPGRGWASVQGRI
jgi:hypothetical protein